VHEPEVERQVHLVGTDEQGDDVVLGTGLDDGHPVAGVGVHHATELPVHVVHGAVVALGDDRLARGRVGERLILDERIGDVDPEAVGAPVHPEPQDAGELLDHLRVAPVEVRLLGGEQVVVPLPRGAVGLLDPGPRRAAEHRLPVVGGLVAARPPAVAEQVAVALG